MWIPQGEVRVEQEALEAPVRRPSRRILYSDISILRGLRVFASLGRERGLELAFRNLRDSRRLFSLSRNGKRSWRRRGP